MAIKCKRIIEIEKSLSNKDASLKYGVPKNTISAWVKKRELFASSRTSWYKQNQEVTGK